MKTVKIFLAGMMVLMAQTILAGITATGVVLDKNTGEGVIGASVVEKGTSNGTITDFDGNFTLEVSDGAVLEVRYVGYAAQEVAAGKNLKIMLAEDTEVLEELVVTGYTTQRKADLTGSVSVVDTKALKNTSNPDPMSSLQGKVAGVTIHTDGSPCASGQVRIRGIGSINSNCDPLYIIDGVPTTMALNTMNAADIESMQVLKDAASASIYGSRAANGVIIITTKSGKAGKADQPIHVDASASVTTSFYNGQTKMNLCNTEEYATAMIQAALNDGKDPATYAFNYGLNINAAGGVPVRAYNPATGQYENYSIAGAYGPNGEFINSKQTMRFSNTDWLDEISRVGVLQNYDVALSHATDKTTQLFSVGYKRSEGVLKYTDFQSLSFRLNSSYNFGKYVTVGENFAMTYTDQVNCAPLENTLKICPTIPVYEEDGTTFGGPVGGMSDRQNPMRELYFNRDNRLRIWRLFGNAFVDIKPTKGLVIRSSFGMDRTASFMHSMNYTFKSDVVNNATASSTVGQTNSMRWTWSNTANYAIPMPANHNLNVLLGFEMNHETIRDVNGYAEDYAIETERYMWLNAATGVQKAHAYEESYALMSYFGKIDYNWNDLILASLTVRRDGSSRFGVNNQFATFPAASLGYRFSRHFEDEQDVIDDMKLRLSWGETGNQAISNIARYSIYRADYGNDRGSGTAYDVNLQGSGTFPSGFVADQTANTNIKWETASQYNIGLDFALLHNSLYGTVDAYIKDVRDMLINPAYLGTFGEGGGHWMNGPSLRNHGLELTLGYRNETTNGFKYNVQLNMDYFRSRVTMLPESTKGSYAHTPKQDLVEARMPYGSRVGYICTGLFQTAEEVMASGQENARLGGLKYADLDGNGIIDSNDQTWILNPVPDLSAGLNFDCSYKGFDFQMFFQGVFGSQVYNDQKFQTDFWSLTDAGSNKGNRMLQAWTPDNTSSTIPALTTDNIGDEGRQSTYFVEKGSWVKLRNLQFGYTLPSDILKKMHFSNFRVYISGQNLFTIKSKAYTCTDPENAGYAYPTSTSFTAGVQIGL